MNELTQFWPVLTFLCVQSLAAGVWGGKIYTLVQGNREQLQELKQGNREQLQELRHALKEAEANVQQLRLEMTRLDGMPAPN